MTEAKVLMSSAELSLDGLYRWKLGRIVTQGDKIALWIGVNPSTADAEYDDQSIRKLYGFGERLGIREWMVGNLFAYRAADVNELAHAPDPVGVACDTYLREMVNRADLVIAGWGRIDKVPSALRHRVTEVVQLVNQAGKQLMCWGTCQDGSPRHPLMIPYTTPLEMWQ